MKISVAVLCLFVAATLARCQLVEVGSGPPDPHYCDKVKVDPNLVLNQDARISGRLLDQSGAAFEISLVELRLFISPTKQSAVAKVTTDHDGQFRFDSVKAGKYRLIASSTRPFQQPSELRCDSNKCEFAITLRVNPTDMPNSQCPVR
jgi:Carboxypeptidase regulatory-like domain